MRKYYAHFTEKGKKSVRSKPFNSLNECRKYVINCFRNGKAKNKIVTIETNNTSYGGVYGYVLDYRSEYGFFGWVTAEGETYHILNKDGKTVGIF